MTALLLAAAIAADGVALEALKEAPPEGLSEAVRKELAGEGLRIVQGGKPLYDFWLRKTVPTQAPREDLQLKLTELAPGTLVAALRVHAVTPDFRTAKVPAGVYTLRYGVQPEDGDHQGTSDTKDFLLLVQAAADPTPGPIAPDPLNKLSSKVLGRKHPAVLYLVRTTGAAEPAAVVHDEPKERWILECRTAGSAETAKVLLLGIVVVGKANE
jgi:hypothetical protein